MFTYFDLMKHRGEIVRNAVQKSGHPKATLARKLGITRNTLYNRLDRPDLEWDFIIDVYAILKKEVAEDFPELSKYISHEPEPHHESALDECQKQLNEYKDKYIRLMEEYNEVLKQNRSLQARQTGTSG